MIYSQQTYPRQGCQKIDYGTMNVPAMTSTGQMHKASNQSISSISQNHPQEKAFKSQDLYMDRSTEGPEVEKMTDIVHPHPHDVLCGRGGSSNRHIGNTNFRDLVNCNKALYVTLTKRQKMMVARSIVQAVRNQNPRGRFLQKDPVTGLWGDIGRPRALEKTSQALREKASGASSDSKVGGKQEKIESDSGKNKCDINENSLSSTKKNLDSNSTKKKKLSTEHNNNPDVIPSITIPAHLPQFRGQPITFAGHQETHNAKHSTMEHRIPHCRSRNNLSLSRSQSSNVENNLYVQQYAPPPPGPDSARSSFGSQPKHSMYVNEGCAQIRRIPQSSSEIQSRSPQSVPSHRMYPSINYNNESCHGNFSNQAYQGNYSRNHFHNQYHQGASISPNAENTGNVSIRGSGQHRRTISNHRRSNSHSSQEIRLPPYPPMHPHSHHGMKDNAANRGVILGRDDRQRSYPALHDQSRQYYNNCAQGQPHPGSIGPTNGNIDYNRHLHKQEHYFNSERQPPYDCIADKYHYSREDTDLGRFHSRQTQVIRNSSFAEGPNFTRNENRAYGMPPSSSNQPQQYMAPNDSVSISHDIHNRSSAGIGSSTQEHFYDMNSHGQNICYQNGNKQSQDHSSSMYVTSDYDLRQEMPRIPQVSLTPSTCESNTQSHVHPQSHHPLQQHRPSCVNHSSSHGDDGNNNNPNPNMEYFCNNDETKFAPKIPPLHVSSQQNQSSGIPNIHHYPFSNQGDHPHLDNSRPDLNQSATPHQTIKPNLSNGQPNQNDHGCKEDCKQETSKKRSFGTMNDEDTMNNQSNPTSVGNENDCEHLSKYFRPPTPSPSEVLESLPAKKRFVDKSSSESTNSDRISKTQIEESKNPMVDQSSTDIPSDSTFGATATLDNANIVTPGNTSVTVGNHKNSFISNVVSLTLSASSSMDETTGGANNAKNNGSSRPMCQSLSSVSNNSKHSNVTTETTFMSLGGLAALSKAALLISDDD